MPLSINVGLSRKASRDYQSTGTSINIIAELDQSLLAKPEELHKQIDGLYQQAQDAINRNSAQPESTPREPRSNGRSNGDRSNSDRSNGQRSNGRYPRNGNGNGRRNGHAEGGGSMTDSQRRAILAIAERNNVDVDYECREICGAEFDALTIRQASEFIDHLKSLQRASGNGH